MTGAVDFTSATAAGHASAVVLDPGPRTTVQDAGRPGFAQLGVPRSGAADLPALTLANRLVGNPEGAAALETTLAGPTLRFLRATSIALTGADVDATLDGRPQAMRAVIAVRSGQVLAIGPASDGLRTYLAVRGGIDAPRTLGSCSADQLTGLGPPPLRAGDALSFGAAALELPRVGVAALAEAVERTAAGVPIARVRLGPRTEHFAPDALTTLLTATWHAAASSNRIGVRLTGPALTSADSPMRSEGLVLGAVQVPPSGQPIVMLPDHPTTGGYPVIAVVDEASLPVIAQLQPGQPVAFRVVRATRRVDADRV